MVRILLVQPTSPSWRWLRWNWANARPLKKFPTRATLNWAASGSATRVAWPMAPQTCTAPLWCRPTPTSFPWGLKSAWMPCTTSASSSVLGSLQALTWTESVGAFCHPPNGSVMPTASPSSSAGIPVKRCQWRWARAITRSRCCSLRRPLRYWPTKALT